MDYTTALVTGASSGMGRELALRLAKRGTRVAVCARRADLLADLEKTIALEGGEARVYPLDVQDTEATLATVRRADDEMGGLDLVVANAGVNRSRYGDELTWEDCAPVIRTNVEGAVATLTAVLDRMVERGRGHLVGVSSLAGYRALPGNAAYSASKAFLSVFLEGLRIDLAHVNVAVTDVRPGFVDTPMTRGNRHPQPFKMRLGDAMDLVVRGLERRAPVVEFPWRLAVAARSSRLLPRPVFDAIAQRMRGRR